MRIDGSSVRAAGVRLAVALVVVLVCAAPAAAAALPGDSPASGDGPSAGTPGNGTNQTGNASPGANETAPGNGPDSPGNGAAGANGNAGGATKGSGANGNAGGATKGSGANGSSAQNGNASSTGEDGNAGSGTGPNERPPGGSGGPGASGDAPGAKGDTSSASSDTPGASDDATPPGQSGDHPGEGTPSRGDSPPGLDDERPGEPSPGPSDGNDTASDDAAENGSAADEVTDADSSEDASPAPVADRSGTSAGGATTEDAPTSENASETAVDGDHGDGNATGTVVAAGVPVPDAPTEDAPPMGYGIGVLAAGAAVRYGNTTATHLTTSSAATTALPDHRLFLHGMAGLYSKYDDSDPLEHESRERLLETVVDAPGVHLSELCDRAGVTLSTARHHLRVLEEEGLIATAKHCGKRRYFPADDDERELAAAIADDAAATVLETLAYTGPATVSALAEELGRDPSTVTHHLKRLDEDGLVARERDGRAVMNSLEPAVESVLAPTMADADAPRQTGSAD